MIHRVHPIIYFYDYPLKKQPIYKPMHFTNFYQCLDYLLNIKAGEIMKLTTFSVTMVQLISCNAIMDAELVTEIQELQSQKIDMQ